MTEQAGQAKRVRTSPAAGAVTPMMAQYLEILFAPEGTLVERADETERAFPDDPCVTRVLNFVRSDTSRSLLVPKQNGE